eukprot:922456-Amphidinium_carterae.1
MSSAGSVEESKFVTCESESGPEIVCVEEAGSLAIPVLYEADGLVLAVPAALKTMFENVAGPFPVQVSQNTSWGAHPSGAEMNVCFYKHALS